MLYGIQLNGNGHITRSTKIIKELKNIGHDIDIITSGKNSQIELPFEIIKSFDGLSFFYNKSGSIDWIKTLKTLDIKRFFNDFYNVGEYDVVISDFEPISAWSAKKYDILSIGIGNQYSFNSNKIPTPFIKDIFSEFFMKYFAKTDYNIGIQYEKYDDFIFKPIVEDDIFKPVSDNNFYLIYLPSYSIDFLLNIIKNVNCNFKIYSPEIKKYSKFVNIEFFKPDRKSFIVDLCKSSGIITNCGFSTTSEALVLNKKLWSIPIKGQYEQKCNAISLKNMKVYTDKLNTLNLYKWINYYNKINYKWEDPTKEIIKKIEEYAKN